MKTKLAITAILLAIVVAGYFVFFPGMKDTDPRAGVNHPGPFLPIQAEELVAAYEKNAKEADDRYRMKAVEITGTIRGFRGLFDKDSKVDEIIEIEKLLQQSGIDKEAGVLLMGKRLGAVFFVPPSSMARLRHLQPGESVSIRGVCTGIPPFDTKDIRHVLITGSRLVNR